MRCFVVTVTIRQIRRVTKITNYEITKLRNYELKKHHLNFRERLCENYIKLFTLEFAFTFASVIFGRQTLTL
ncbi:MAG: hypothetical protein LBP59_19445 [Planctomycetaceae bacterium]|nr:hypothetical protein [Planctomycetaceae bacterium]